MTDPVHSPAHYKAGDYECRDVQRALQRTLWSGSPHAHELCNALKYLWRACSKGKFAEDIRKAAYECLSCVDEEWRLRVPPGTVPAKPTRTIRPSVGFENTNMLVGTRSLFSAPSNIEDLAAFIRVDDSIHISAQQCRELAVHLNAWAQQWEERNK